MNLTKEQKLTGARLTMAITLVQDVMNFNYGAVQQICETFNLSNTKVLKKLYVAEKIIPMLPNQQILIDWVYVIYDESEHNELILREFSQIYRKKYAHIASRFDKAEQCYQENKLQKSIDHVNYMKDNYVINELSFMHFLYFTSEIIQDMEVLGVNYGEMVMQMKHFLFSTEKNQDEWTITFNSGETVMATSQYKKYLHRRRTELAEYMTSMFKMEVTEEKLGSVLDGMLVSQACEFGVPVDFGLGGIVNTACKNILIHHNGGLDWYEAITSREGSAFGINLDYKPDVDDIIEKYYIQLMRYVRYRGKEEFSKVYFLRECKAETPLIDLISIMFMYNIDVFTKMFMNLMEEYYKTFSWEKIVNQNLSARYEAIISSLKNDIQTLQGNLSNAHLKVGLLNEQLQKEKGAAIIPVEKMVTEYTKKLDEKDKEIESLKQQLRSRDEFIELLDNENDIEVSCEVDMSVLQAKKYLFVGHIKEAMPELHHKFPNSLFMESENFSLANVKVDGIVMLIKFMSHSMFYKVKANTSLSELPVVRCNTKNINSVYNAMMRLDK